MKGMQWIMVRLERTTHMALLACKARYESEANAARPIGSVRVDRFGLSLNSVVEELIRRDEAHRARAVKASRKRRYARQERNQQVRHAVSAIAETA